MSGDLETAIAKLWHEAQPRLLGRVEALEAAAGRPRSRELWERAAREAHTLIGTLGSFGHMQASETARAAEEAVERRDHVALEEHAAALRAEITACETPPSIGE